jgi:hypothetical protein
LDKQEKVNNTLETSESLDEVVEDVLTTDEGVIHPICSGPAYEVSG